MTKPNTEGLKGNRCIVGLLGFALDRARRPILLEARGGGEIVFNALIATLDFTTATDAADFDWHGSDESEEVRGDGFVELQLDDSLEGEFAYDNGDDSTLEAKPE